MHRGACQTFIILQHLGFSSRESRFSFVRLGCANLLSGAELCLLHELNALFPASISLRFPYTCHYGRKLGSEPDDWKACIKIYTAERRILRSVDI